MKNINLQINESLYHEILQSIEKNTDIVFSIEQIKNILRLYPDLSIRMADSETCSDTDLREGLMDMVSHFFLGCTWPTYGENIPTDEFRELLKKQAVIMHYNVK